MKIKIENRFYHDCDLPTEQRTQQIFSPYDSALGKCGQRIRSTLTINHNIFRHEYFKSSAAYRKEKRRHLANRRYRYIVHPYSSFTQIRTGIAGFMFLIVYLIESFMNCFVLQQRRARFLNFVKTGVTINMLEFFLFLDMVIRFFEGYVDSKTREIVLEPSRIRKRYLKSYFIFDFMPIMSGIVYTIYLHVLSPILQFAPSKNKFVTLFITEFHIFRIARIKLIIETMDKIFKKIGLSEGVRFIVLLVFLGLIILHSLDCVLLTIHNVQKYLYPDATTNWVQIYLNHHSVEVTEFLQQSEEVSFTLAFYLYFLGACAISCHFFGLNPKMYQTRDSIELMYFSFVVVCGIFFKVYCIAQVLELFGVMNIAEKEYQQFVVQAEDYLRNQDVPIKLRKRVFRYYEYKFNKKFFSEKDIMDTLSQHLQLEILLYSCSSLLNQVSLFRGLSKDAIGCLLTLFKQEIFLKGDIIHERSEHSRVIYFILFGTCEIILTLHNQEVMHLEDGDHFGDVSLYDEDKINREYSVKAVERVELFKLEPKDIESACKLYPEIRKKIHSLAKGKARRYNKLFDMMEGEDDKTEDILEELRKGRILYHGIKRTAFL